MGNLYASLLQALACSPAVVHQVSLVAGVAVFDAICAVAGEKRIAGLRLKWPNDVLIGEAKCAGILAESQMGDREPVVVAVIGIGINLVSHPGDLARATTSLAAHGVEATPEQMLGALAESMQHWLEVWDNGAGFARVRAAWLERGGKAGESLAVDTGSEKIAGTFVDLDADGALADAGRARRAAQGDVRGCHARAVRQHGRRVMAQQPRARGRGGADELVFMALGGIGEIGMNCYLYGLGPPDARQWLMIDLGITFPEGENDPGIDVILPDVRFIEEERARWPDWC